MASRLLWAVLVCLPLTAQTAKRIEYEDDVKPIFQRHCLTCHGAAQMTAGLSLESYAGVLKGGGSGEIVKPGRSSASLLYQVLAQETDGLPHMPLGQPKIPDGEIAIVRDWIQQGLLADSTSQPKGQTTAPVGLQPVAARRPEGQPPMPGNLAAVDLPKPARPHPVTALAANPWSPLLAVAGHERIYLYDLKTRSLLGALPFPEGIPYVLRFSRDGATLLAGGGRGVQSGRVVLYDVRTGKPERAAVGQERRHRSRRRPEPGRQDGRLGEALPKIVKVFSVPWRDNSSTRSTSTQIGLRRWPSVPMEVTWQPRTAPEESFSAGKVKPAAF